MEKYSAAENEGGREEIVRRVNGGRGGERVARGQWVAGHKRVAVGSDVEGQGGTRSQALW